MVCEFEAFASKFEDSPEAARRISELGRELFERGVIKGGLLKGLGFVKERGEEVYHHPDFDFYLERHCLLVGQVSVPLSRNETSLLYSLVCVPNRTVSNSELRKGIYGSAYNLVGDDLVRIAVSRLRQKFRRGGVDSEVICTHLGGYALVDTKFIGEEIDIGKSSKEPVYHHPDFDYFPERSLVKADGRDVWLSPQENLFLGSLSGSLNKVVSFDTLIDAIWNGGKEPEFPLVQIAGLARRLRKKIWLDKLDKTSRKILGNRWGKGYVLIDESQTN